jgi:hypothetical protein
MVLATSITLVGVLVILAIIIAVVWIVRSVR